MIALLAVLAAVIGAAGSTVGRNPLQEQSRTTARAIIQLGQTHKAAFDRIIALGASIATADIDVAGTASRTAQIPPAGGGAASESPAAGAETGSDSWLYTFAAIPDLGGPAAERLALLRVTQDVCAEINRLLGTGYDAAPADYDAFDDTVDLDATHWPAALRGSAAGCIASSNAVRAGFFFYQTLAVQ